MRGVGCFGSGKLLAESMAMLMRFEWRFWLEFRSGLVAWMMLVALRLLLLSELEAEMMIAVVV